ncbi:MAG: DUF2924 domain-containing protein [Rhodobacterales bacterium]|nr:DUF2924 domain-containing protein [Rhodobacterales bacterium]
MTSLADLETMDRKQLAQLWCDLIGSEVPDCMSQTMQRRFLAFELQAGKEGGLPPALLARLDRIAAGEERKASPTVKPGARLLRAWNGVTHVVDVLPDGYLWNGARHRSLSAIARAITGARWSGPRFFGLASSGETETGRKGRTSSKRGSPRSKDRAA